MSGRTPRQIRKDSAACSTSMPQPLTAWPAPAAFGPAGKRSFTLAVRHVVAERGGRNGLVRYRNGLAAEARGRCIDDEIELGIRNAVEPNGPDGSKILEVADELLAARPGAIGHQDGRRCSGQQRLEDAAGSAAGSQDQDGLAGHGKAEILAQIAQEPGAVGVVPDQLVAPHADRIHSLRTIREGRELVHEFRRRLLVGHGDVEALAAGRKELDRADAKTLGREVQQTIGHGLAGLFGEHAMDERRPAVPDRMTDDGVSIGLGSGCLHGRAARSFGRQVLRVGTTPALRS